MNSINVFSDVSFVTAVIGALIAGLAGLALAAFTNILSHKNNQKRDAEQYYNEIYKSFFTHIVPDIFLFINLSTGFLRANDSSENDEIAAKDRVVEFTKNNLIHATPRIISLYNDMNSSRYGDQTSFNPKIHELIFLKGIAEEYEKVITSTSIFSGKKYADNMYSVYRVIILYTLSASLFYDLAGHNFYFNENKYTKRNYMRLKKIMRSLSKKINRLEKIHNDIYKSNRNDNNNTILSEDVYVQHEEENRMQCVLAQNNMIDLFVDKGENNEQLKKDLSKSMFEPWKILSYWGGHYQMLSEIEHSIALYSEELADSVDIIHDEDETPTGV